jgi:DNA primase
LRQQGFQVRFTESQQVIIKCPHCHDYKFRLYVSQSKKLGLCFNCGWKGNALGLVKLVSGAEGMAAVDIIASGARSVAFIGRDVEPLSPVKPAQLPEHFRPLTMPPTPASQPYWDYLIGRGFAPSLIMKYRIGYCRVGEYHHRIVVPIYMEGELRSWVARAIGKARRKYLNDTGMRMASCLFNYDHVVGEREAVLVEGVFDALRLPQRAIATLGNKISTRQVDLLRAGGFERLIFCYDADAGLQAIRYADRLPPDVEVCIAHLPKGYDPGNAPVLMLDRALREARPVRHADYAEAGIQ